MELSPYLMFNGNCEDALKFYEQTLGAKIDGVSKHGGTPSEEHVPPDWRDKVLHARFTVGDTVVMASDAPPGHYAAPQGMSIALGLKDIGKGEEIFNKLAENGTVQMPFSPTFWAKGFGMCVDRFGIPWMVNCE
ncbi:MAG TPA: VOC family protein [Pyrinomonadaceae bacterium]|jgi:PhnB protein|nr:VOC family protein [Pyrinomonadaceae bacterium]